MPERSWGSATSTARWSAVRASKPTTFSPSSRRAVLDRDAGKGLVPRRLAYPPRMGDGRISMTRSGLSLVVTALLLQAPATHAAQLDKDSCSKLKVEQTQLEQGGTRGSLIRGP